VKRIKAILELLGDRPVVFVGMMGSGKSAVGRLLASELSLPYADSDAEIEQAAGMKIAEIFAQFGEEYFRAGEQRVIARLLTSGRGVISLGGGAFMSEATREDIRRHAVSVWLKADLDLLMARVMRKPGTRPLLQTADPRATLAALMEKRAPVYALADLHIESSRISKQQTCDNVVRALHEWLRRHPPHEPAPTGKEDGA
jgi:shikimate kinase